MRTMLRYSFPADKGNAAIKDGSHQSILERLLGDLKPEATYFFAEDGERGGLLVFDMTDSAQIPQIAEPLFVHLDARLEFIPVMNLDDLKRGLAA